jgi:predicted nucleic acid-binding Zn ribbon protein
MTFDEYNEKDAQVSVSVWNAIQIERRRRKRRATIVAFSIAIVCFVLGVVGSYWLIKR